MAYKDNGFTVLGISVDAQAYRKDWIKAIKDDHLPWTQVSDLKTRNEVAALYKVAGFPTNFLIDPNGRIVARDLHGADLTNKLKDIFDSK